MTIDSLDFSIDPLSNSQLKNESYKSSNDDYFAFDNVSLGFDAISGPDCWSCTS
ncbi:7861_t:CDS:2 [Funneliformis mosseae]|uniref:7861_t:CDS:1 n=1 Tax=Funneliformis mosseae TaxID=27381 RepID=A0A9N9E1Y0_FUNMO|nr:7861_t:CDS:2 [Funneliformis mosseae]